MESIDPKCTPIKKKYDACFQEWHSEFMKNPGKFKNVIPCEKLFTEYQMCLKDALVPLQDDIDQAREYLKDK